MKKFNQGTYLVKNPDKYVSRKIPKYKSSLERMFFIFLDTNESILKWSYENIKIPYISPLNGKIKNYIPDFMIQYIDKKGKIQTEIIEVKSHSHILGNSKRPDDKIQGVINNAKFRAAQAFCKSKGMRFRVVTEKHMKGKIK